MPPIAAAAGARLPVASSVTLGVPGPAVVCTPGSCAADCQPAHPQHAEAISITHAALRAPDEALRITPPVSCALPATPAPSLTPHDPTPH